MRPWLLALAPNVFIATMCHEVNNPVSVECVSESRIGELVDNRT